MSDEATKNEAAENEATTNEVTAKVIPFPTPAPVLKVEVRLVIEGEAKGLVYTDGLAKLGLPELEIRNVPLFLGPEGKRILSKVAHHLLSGGKVSLGDTMAIGDAGIKFMFEELVAGRWTLTDAALTGQCSDPNCTKDHREAKEEPA